MLGLDSMQDTMREIMKKQDEIILDQLGELVKRGLIVVEKTQGYLVQSECSNKIEWRQGIRLLPKEREYIDALEKENKMLKEKMFAIQNAVSGVL